MASRVLTRKNVPPPGRHVFLPKGIIFELFHEDWTIHVASIEKNALSLCSHVFQAKVTIFKLIQGIIEMNLLTKFHEDRKINVVSRVLTRFYYSHIRNNAPPLGSHVFQAKVTIFELIQDIIGTNLLSKFHEDRKINVASRMLTRKNAPPLAAIFMKIIQKNVASRVLTRFYYSHIRKNAPPLGSHVFQANVTIFELIQDIIETNLLTKFHEDWTENANRSQNMASRVLTRKNVPPPGRHVFLPKGIIFELFHEDWTIHVASIEKNALSLCSHVFQAKVTIFKLIQGIIEMNLLTKFHEDRKINVVSRVLTRFYYSHIRNNAPPLGSHVFQAKVTIFELIQDIIGTNLLSKFHEDRKINVASRMLTRKNAPPLAAIFMKIIQKNVASRVLTRFYYSHIRKNAPPLGSHVFQANVTIFELIQDIIETNLLTKFHEDWTENVASRELTRQMLTAHDGQKAITKAHHEHVVLR
ncbi:hypothetical protein DPMN_045000 [Dreissena polymorpha]|uniref:Uncharacterized protein n=1 Tax=Dreissena polymorpha TaxID=45954 RepID=A0A9D4D5N0_DREPO|nr:hypothetical protein DPMN_045000 [Dreissena polymorpha]